MAVCWRKRAAPGSGIRAALGHRRSIALRPHTNPSRSPTRIDRASPPGCIPGEPRTRPCDVVERRDGASARTRAGRHTVRRGIEGPPRKEAHRILLPHRDAGHTSPRTPDLPRSHQTTRCKDDPLAVAARSDRRRTGHQRCSGGLARRLVCAPRTLPRLSTAVAHRSSSSRHFRLCTHPRSRTTRPRRHLRAANRRGLRPCPRNPRSHGSRRRAPPRRRARLACSLARPTSGGSRGARRPGRSSRPRGLRHTAMDTCRRGTRRGARRSARRATRRGGRGLRCSDLRRLRSMHRYSSSRRVKWSTARAGRATA